MDAVLVLSHHLREKTIELGARPQATHLWSQGVDISRFFPGDRQAARQRLGISPAARMLLWVGRMVPVKGLDVFLDAAAELRRRGVAFDAHLIGDGPLRAALEAKTAALGLADRIHFPGSRKPAELPDWYRAADLTLLPSHSEGMPNVLRESLACGTRFVASNVGGISEIAGDAAVNRLVPAGNSQALADALQSVLAGPTPPVTGFTPPSWEQSAAALTAILASINSPRSPIQTGQARSQTDRYFPQSVDVAKQPAVSDAR
jgi:glycosyltransferase involved in cell wall biosynthesis